ncbi:MAG: hypothetical protein CL868_19790 [Cytophagaceae bacterium]|nr:hypothetical protein [Cytophagaceae bacterium]|tara:strand:- start:4869 stop:5054 length:186 start_codon:yes stop_codon:yes gene_type:complete
MNYKIRWNNEGYPSYELPNTTLWHTQKSINQVVEDLKNVSKQLGVTLEKTIAVLASEFVGV